ncbi:endolytic transglycosylase MltG [Sphingobacteriales bacterium UPWRP_1]|nr:hypothetical protein B6N25_07395 [Sphingobacteriales bacterium TSM_CSS]PSJ78717.1 endolytic transglycosylase MltG [Sphingobacteriales bacterium UPWRP_1]
MTQRSKRVILYLFAFLAIAATGVCTFLYLAVFGNNIQKTDKEYRELFIRTGWTFEQVKQELTDSNIIKNAKTFDWVAKRMNYPNKIYPGRYIVKPGMSNRSLVTMLRSGKQTPYNLAINNIRTKEQLVTLVCGKLEADSTELKRILSDTAYLAQYNLSPDKVIAIFIANTYQFNWNTGAETFFKRMKKEFDDFWTDERKQKAEKQGITPFEVITLASIVDEETAQPDEMNKIAGVYYNRLRQKMPLQADPTIKFAVGDFTLRRILTEHLAINSPYNTYKNIGLPPGPIRIPSMAALNAVLNPEEHNYVYFCAREDFSGYHNFAATYEEHLINARKYRDELDRRNIK